MHPEAIEVLLRNRCYVVKRFGTDDGYGNAGDSLKGRQITWAKHGGAVVAWEKAKTDANWPVIEDSTD